MKNFTGRKGFLSTIAVWLLVALGTVPLISYGQAHKSGKAVQAENIPLADPTIFYHEGTYYLYGTVEGGANEGFFVYTSSDMKTWEGPKGIKEGYALKKGDAYGSKGFWAPQVFYTGGKFYMAYTADENIAIATSNSPLGPFTQAEKAPLAAPVKQIDPFVFIDADGKKYLYHVRLTNGNRIFVAEMTDDFSAIKQETLRECISAQEPWENTVQAEWPVTEGPSILRQGKLYYLVYTANDFRNPDYAVGYATSTSPLGPWEKQKDSPILSKAAIGINGTGHGDFFTDKKGQLYYVFHTHYSDTKVGPRQTGIVKARFAGKSADNTKQLTISNKSFYYPKLEK
ncbi:glycoside hydrolase family 43 protein [Pontibacter sp. SGAir0037]|uniref:glycoside hydrolase family 43 protein n=1 Tax=Pontibacter sp. SGAir0037 TaxID=2571030 RepID=UPI0010CD3ED2|nr:glycoside hydrolase family 43 protein [Pontibacter sp. SGAir0037]QCR23033.1 beta-xylosidase [Pontibacter sp. SGAir0037]